jgi:predicted secreted protein
MADFFKGLAGGFGTGLQFGQAMREREERDRLRQAAGLTPQEMQQRQASPEELARAQAETQALAAEDARMFGLGPQEQAAYAPQMPVEGQRVGLPRYQLAGQTFDRAPTQQEIQQARFGAMADVISERDPARAMQMRQQLEDQAYQARERPLRLQSLEGQIAGQAQQRQLTDLQLTDAQRKQRMQEDFDTGFADINKQKFEKPEERTAAILSLVERTQGVTAAQQLRASYSQNELNQISLQSKKFDEGFRQSRAKGVIPALEWFDEQNTSFKLERDPKNPFRVIQVNTDGSRQLFADAKNERELGMIIDAKAKPGGFLELAKYDLDQQKAQAAIAKDRALAGLYNQGGAGAGKGTLKQKVSDFKEVYGRDPTEEEKGVLAGLVTKEPNKPDADREAWLKAEQKLIEADTSPESIDAQRTAFFVRRGYAPAAARQVLEAGVNPATGKPLTRSDVDAYNKTYPQTPVDPGSLPWLPSPEREAQRQGLISQIPR